MNVTVTINAPEIVKALDNLAVALTVGSARVTTSLEEAAQQAPAALAQEFVAAFQPELQTSAQQAPVTPIQQAPIQQVAPVQPATPAAVPTQPETVPMQQAPITPAAVPTTPQTYTMEQLAVAATQLVDAGRRAELVNLLTSFGVQALTGLPKDQYGAFATQLRAMGAKI